MCDPHAAAKVFAAPLELTAVGVDVTGHCRLEATVPPPFPASGGAMHVRCGDGRSVVSFCGAGGYFSRSTGCRTPFEPSLCQTTAQRIEVALMHKHTLGRTRLVNEAVLKPHHVAHSVEVAKFFAHYFAIVGG